MKVEPSMFRCMCVCVLRRLMVNDAEILWILFGVWVFVHIFFVAVILLVQMPSGSV